MPNLTEIKTKPDQDLIAHLEKTLEYAKSGQLQGMIEVYIWDDGSTASGWALSSKFVYKLSAMFGEMFLLFNKLGNRDTGVLGDIDEIKDTLGL